MLYLRWELENSDPNHVILDRQGSSHVVTHRAGILTAKAKVAKLENVPRNEICGLVLLARLVTAVLPGLTDRPKSFLPMLDSRFSLLKLRVKS